MGKKLLKNTEWTILIVSLLLFVIGLVALFSATQSTEYGEFKKQKNLLLIKYVFFARGVCRTWERYQMHMVYDLSYEIKTHNS